MELQLNNDSDIKNDKKITGDGIEWQNGITSCTVGRIPIYNVFKDVLSPIGYAKRNIMKGNVKSAFP